jgi:ATP synthase F1 epsilon subunit
MAMLESTQFDRQYYLDVVQFVVAIPFQSNFLLFVFFFYINNHAPLITALDIGPIILRKQSKWTALALIGGFALVKDNQITILVNEAVDASSIDDKQAEKDLERATDRLNQANGEKEKIEAAFAFKRARTRYQIVQWKDRLSKSVMSKYRGPRLRLIRRLGELPALTRKSPKFNRRVGKGSNNKAKITQFSYRLAEKQKLRFHYGISEKQLVLYVKKKDEKQKVRLKRYCYNKLNNV